MDYNEEKKGLTVFGVSIWKILLYFIIYSILGFILETIFGLITKGVLESRKSFLIGPFCGIYGLGAIVMILSLRNVKKNNFSLFFGGFIIGSIVEYVVSWFGEVFLNVIWWDYSNIPFNINGRICIEFSIIWGLLAIFLMTYCNPKVDNFIDWLYSKFSIKLLKIIISCIILFLFFDACITGFALKMFFTRLVNDYNLNLANTSEYIVKYSEMYNNQKVKELVNKYFSNEVILKTFPNLKVTKEDGEILYVSSIFPDIQAEYVRIFTPVIKR